MKHLWTGFVRCYYNATEEAPLFWSVDDGDPAHEVKCTAIVLSGSGRTGCDHVSGGQPKAWIEIERAVVVQLPDRSISISSCSENHAPAPDRDHLYSFTGSPDRTQAV